MLTRTSRLDRSVQRQQVRLIRQIIDHLKDPTDLLRLLTQAQRPSSNRIHPRGDRVHRRHRRTHRNPTILGMPQRLRRIPRHRLSRLRDLRRRRRQLLNRRRRLSHRRRLLRRRHRMLLSRSQQLPRRRSDLLTTPTNLLHQDADVADGVVEGVGEQAQLLLGLQQHLRRLGELVVRDGSDGQVTVRGGDEGVGDLRDSHLDGLALTLRLTAHLEHVGRGLLGEPHAEDRRRDDHDSDGHQGRGRRTRKNPGRGHGHAAADREELELPRLEDHTEVRQQDEHEAPAGTGEAPQRVGEEDCREELGKGGRRVPDGGGLDGELVAPGTDREPGRRARGDDDGQDTDGGRDRGHDDLRGELTLQDPQRDRERGHEQVHRSRRVHVTSREVVLHRCSPLPTLSRRRVTWLVRRTPLRRPWVVIDRGRRWL